MGNVVNSNNCLKAGGALIAAAGFGMVLLSASFGGHTWMIITGASIGGLGLSALAMGCFKADKAAKKNLLVDDWRQAGADFGEDTYRQKKEPRQFTDRTVNCDM